MFDAIRARPAGAGDDGAMPEEFEDQDLREAVFWGVDLRGAHFRDVDLTGVTVFSAFVVDVDIDGHVERLVVNGVDVTGYVNERDPWYPLRAQVRADDVTGMRAAWEALEREWSSAVDRARDLTEEQRRQSVDGEWSFVQTLRHVVFAVDKWLTVPILGEEAFHPIGLPNTGSKDFGWPGLDAAADPSFEDALAVRDERAGRVRSYLDDLDPADLDRVVEVLENGPNPVRQCVAVVLEEAFQHLRYALRDLDRLT